MRLVTDKAILRYNIYHQPRFEGKAEEVWSSV